MEETLRVLVALGLGLLLVLLRLDAERFGVAEYVGSTSGSPRAVVTRRLTWYGLGLAVVLAIDLVHPDAPGQLNLGLGDAATALLAGFAYGAVGIGLSFLVGILRQAGLRPPDPRASAREILDAAATAFVDEFAFRGVLLGFLLATGLDPLVAVVIQALGYTLATRTGAPGRDPYLLAVSLGIGLLGGWLTVATGAVGAAFIGHAITRFAVYGFLPGPGGERRTREPFAAEPAVPLAGEVARDARLALGAPEPRRPKR